MAAKRKSKFDNKFKSTVASDSRTANVRNERKVEDDQPKLSLNFKDFDLTDRHESFFTSVCFHFQPPFKTYGIFHSIHIHALVHKTYMFFLHKQVLVVDDTDIIVGYDFPLS